MRERKLESNIEDISKRSILLNKDRLMSRSLLKKESRTNLSQKSQKLILSFSEQSIMI